MHHIDITLNTSQETLDSQVLVSGCLHGNTESATRKTRGYLRDSRRRRIKEYRDLR